MMLEIPAAMCKSGKKTCGGTSVCPFVVCCSGERKFILCWESQMSLLRGKCKHLMVALGLSTDHTFSKRCLAAFVG